MEKCKTVITIRDIFETMRDILIWTVYYMLYFNVRFPKRESDITVMSVYVLVLRRQMLKYLEVTDHEVCSLFASNLTTLQNVHTPQINLIWGNVGSW